MRKKIGVLGGLALVAFLLVTLAGTALAQPPAPTTQNYGFGFLDRVTLQRVANLLGTTPVEVTTQLQGGKTLAQLAQAKEVTEQALTDTILQPVKDQLALQVKYGYLTQEEADARLQYEQTRTRELINTGFTSSPEDGYGPWQGRGFGGPGGMMGGFGGMMRGLGGMMGGFGDMMGGFGGMMGGFGGMMGGFGGMMGSGGRGMTGR